MRGLGNLWRASAQSVLVLLTGAALLAAPANAQNTKPVAPVQTSPTPAVEAARVTNKNSEPGFGRGERVSGAPWSGRSAVVAPNGAAATAHPLATQAAIDVLRRGGSAVDAAIAANAVLGLVEPVGCGMGGDLYAIVWDPKTQHLYGYNGSGKSPMGRSLEETRAIARSKGKTVDGVLLLPSFGAVTVTVPGAVDGWFALHGKFGRLKMSDNLSAAIHYADNGAPIPETIAFYMEGNRRRLERAYKEGQLEEIANARATYWPQGSAPTKGALFKNPDLASTYRIIAQKGRKAFYEGEIAARIDAYMRRIGGHLRAADFAAHKGLWLDPACVPYHGVEVCGLGQNAQGLSTLQILQILDGFDLKSMGFLSADSLHAQIEAKRLAFEDRALAFHDPESSKFDQSQLLDPAYAALRRQRIDMQHAAENVQPGLDALRSSDTTYLTVADKDGMMVSLIQSNYRGMGSGLIPDDGKGATLGFMFQDRGAQFSLDPKHANSWQPGKRPFHTIIPAFITKDGKPLMSFGLMGGGMQPQGHAQIVVNMVDFGMTVQAAGDAARFHHDGSTDPEGGPPMTTGGVLEVESGVPTTIADELKRRGHTVKYSVGPYGGYQAIWRDPVTGVYWGASEFRKDGQAAGY